MNDKQINALVNKNPNQVSAPVLVAALAEMKKREDTAAAERAIGQMQEARRTTDSAVSALREARKTEARAKKYLVEVDAAEKAFLTTGDFVAYSDAVQKAYLNSISRQIRA